MTIQALLDRFPIQTGSVELLGYLQIAHEDGHEIDRSQSIELFADWEGSRARVLRHATRGLSPSAARLG